jgi:phosphoglucomutase
MAAGFACMNDLTVIQATQGLCMYLLSLPDHQRRQNQGIVVGFDHRHHSEHFALLTAMVFLSKQFRVYVFHQMTPTPLVPFAVKRLGACAGVMITASHNPKADNGYKLYWDNACQVISPHDKHIQKAIAEYQQPWTWDTTRVREQATRIEESLISEYFENIRTLAFRSVKVNTASALKMVYTAMHGVGYPFACRSLQVFGLPAPIPVQQQIQPDPDFPTVKYPNPEEGAGALKLAMETADANDCRLIFANDPDADRLAVAEKQPV